MSESRVGRTFTDIGQGVAMWRIWMYLAWHDTSSRYRRSILGPFWIAGAMVATALSLSIVFGAIFGQPLREVMPYILSGLVAWQLVSLPLAEGPELFLNQAGTIKNNNFPISLYIFQFMLRALIVAAHNVVVLVIALLVFWPDQWPNWQVIPGLVLVVVFGMVLSPLVGLAASRYRDIRFMLPHISQLLFFLSPVFWRPEDVPPVRSGILDYNPFYYILTVLRDPIIGKYVPLHVWGVALAIVVGGAVTYIVAISAYRRRLPFWI